MQNLFNIIKQTVPQTLILAFLYSSKRFLVSEDEFHENLMDFVDFIWKWEREPDTSCE